MPSADPDELPHGFAGVVRLFPLPDLVMFPYVVQPLHIFEPRYREMLADALRGDRLIAMALFDPGWEADYQGRPPLKPLACVGKVTSCRKLPDGKSNLLLKGICRVRIESELPADRPFRQAQVKVLTDAYPAIGAAQRSGLSDRLLDEYQKSLPAEPNVQKAFGLLRSQDLPLGRLTDFIAHALDLNCEAKERLLTELNVDRRAMMLLQAIAARQPEATSAQGGFPPDFSVN